MKFDNIRFQNSDIEITKRVLNIKNIALTNEELCHISYKLGMQVRADLKVDGYYWNTSVDGADGKIYG
jgi:hypothetical protein